jgi:hypothetical protein
MTTTTRGGNEAKGRGGVCVGIGRTGGRAPPSIPVRRSSPRRRRHRPSMDREGREDRGRNDEDLFEIDADQSRGGRLRRRRVANDGDGIHHLVQEEPNNFQGVSMVTTNATIIIHIIIIPHE